MAKLVMRGLLAGSLIVLVLSIASASGAASGLTSAGGAIRARARARVYIRAGIAAGERAVRGRRGRGHTVQGERAQPDRRRRYAIHAGQAEAFRIWTQTSGVTDVVHMRIDLGSTARTLVVGIYSNAGGHPGVLLSSGSEPYPRAHAWGEVPVAPVRLVVGRTYWLAVLGVGGTLRYRDRRLEPCLSDLSIRRRLRELPRRWGTGRMRARVHCPLSAYVAASPASTVGTSAFGPTPSPLQSASALVPSPAPAESRPLEAQAPPPEGSSAPPKEESTPKEESSKEKTPEEKKKQEEQKEKEEREKKEKEEKAKEEKLKKEKEEEEKAKESTPKDCFENPETEGTSRIETCGYPGPKDTGVAEASGKTECSALPKSASGAKTITKSETIEDTDITGQVTVAASSVTLKNDCIVYDGHEASGSSAVILEAGASDFMIADTTVRAENDAGDSFEEALSNDPNAAGARASNDRLEDCGECLHQEWTLTGSYVIANGQRITEETDPGEVHREDWYCNDNTIAAEDNTLLNPHDQTAVIFCDTNLGSGGACSDHVTATGNLIAGSGYMFYPCGNSSSAGTSTMTVTGNRFARCLGATKYESSTGGTACAAGPDANGYWPYGGYFGVAASYYTGADQVWTGNYWDDDLATAGP